MAINFKQVSYSYSAKSILETKALKNINLSLELDHIYFIIGHTGSGKSTLAQLFNGLLLPSSGTVNLDLHSTNLSVDAKSKGKFLKQLRKHVGVVFQFPEYQLFEETVLKDVMFGPKNFNYTLEQSESLAKNYLSLCGIDKDLYSTTPFNLSGGQKRRVAIAGILAFEPEVVILDEPTAGLDPIGAEQIMKVFLDYYAKGNKTLIIISHQMDDVLKYAHEVVVLNEGEISFKGKPIELFSDKKLLAKNHLELPTVLDIADNLISKGFKLDINKIKDLDDLIAEFKLGLNK